MAADEIFGDREACDGRAMTEVEGCKRVPAFESGSICRTLSYINHESVDIRQRAGIYAF